MGNEHSEKLSAIEISHYFDDLISGLPKKLNFYESMDSMEWRAVKLYKTNKEELIDALKIWLAANNQFKNNAAMYLANKLNIDFST